MPGGKFCSITRANRRLNSSSISYYSQNNQFVYSVCIYTTNKDGVLPSRDRVAYNSIAVLKQLLNEVKIREKIWTPQNRKKYDNLEKVINNIKTKRQLKTQAETITSKNAYRPLTTYFPLQNQSPILS